MADRTSLPELPWVSMLPRNSSRPMSGGGGSAAAADREISNRPIATRSARGAIVVVFQPVEKIQVGEKFRVLVRGEQFDVAHAHRREIVVGRGEPEQRGDGEHDSGGGEAANRQQPARTH